MALVLTPEEAEALSLHSLGGADKSPEAFLNALLT